MHSDWIQEFACQYILLGDDNMNVRVTRLHRLRFMIVRLFYLWPVNLSVNVVFVIAICRHEQLTVFTENLFYVVFLNIRLVE
ncbi:hypothetical protein LT42_25460 [Pseudomonas lutea]|uniref:Uncharacterized protein n=1 Tax=Pseudomonas lutea TaxID=243924 RepID=A0A9X0EAA2_9PSED|nr:hypothetical protein LT42_25460 [Pseudomonas lutea]